MRNKINKLSQIKKKKITMTSLIIPLLLNVTSVNAEELDENNQGFDTYEQSDSEVLELNKKEMEDSLEISGELLEKESNVQTIELFNYFTTVADPIVSKTLEKSIEPINNDKVKTLYIISLINHELGNYQDALEQYNVLLDTEMDQVIKDLLITLIAKAKTSYKISDLNPEDLEIKENQSKSENIKENTPENTILDNHLDHDLFKNTNLPSDQVTTIQLNQMSSDELYTNAMTLPSATPAWNAVQELKKLYPKDSRIVEAINTTGRRQLILGMSNHRKGDFNKANEYYSRILNEVLINDSLRAETFFHQSRSLNKQDLSTADDLYDEAMTSPSATPAWNAAQQLKKAFPEDSRVNKAINTTANRQLILGMSSHRKDEYTKATDYYNRIINESLVNKLLKAESIFYRESSLKKEVIRTADDLYNEAMTSPSATPAWNAAQKLKEIFPLDTRITKAINTTARRQLILGVSSHRNRDFKKANEYYSRILDESAIDNLIRIETNFYHDQALKKQTIRTADDLYNEAMTSPGATPAWNAAQKLKEIFPLDSRLNYAINTTANRQLILGMSSHRESNYDNAKDYYDRILGETLISKSVRQEVTVYLTQAINRQVLRTADDLYNQAMTSPGATPAWSVAQDLLKLFPHDTRTSTAINTTANRQLILGMSNHRQNKYKKANEYYERIIGESKVNNSLRQTTAIYLNQSLKNQTLRTADDMYNDAITLLGATPAWNAAQELKNMFPNDARVNAAINTTANRQLILGKSSHLKGNFKNASNYYNRILSEDRVKTMITQETSVYLSQATNGESLRTADMIYSDAENANGATPAWRFARELKLLFPHDSRARTLLNRSAQRLLILGTNSHKKNDLRNAKSYYENIMLEPSLEKSIYQKAESYNYLVENNLGLTNMIVRYTNYPTHITNATNKQMALNAKPQISHNGGWRDATRVEVLFNINPLNSIPMDINYALSTLRIVASTLNVRSGPGVENTIIQKVQKDEMYTIIDEQNGWYKIALANGRHGWVSSESMYIKRDTNVLQFLVLSGSSIVSTTELNKVLSGAGILSNQGSAFNIASTLSNVNELYLVAHSLLETGNGTSNLATGIRVTEVNGKSVTPRIVYNMYGIGAHDSNPDKFGSERAYTEGWFTPEQAIIGGAEWISKSYINNPTYKQDTLYKMRWNPDSPGTHQYATDVAWAQKQTRDLIKIVSLARKHNLLLNFNIPIYN